MGAAPYVDPATGILINKLGLTDADALQWAEGFHTKLAARDALNFADGARHLNEETFKQIHRMLFGAVYEWAGEFRSIHIRKEEGGLPFAPPDRLEGQMGERILPTVNRTAQRAGSDDRVFADALGVCWGELNVLHPMREGNGRSTQIIVNALAHRHGRDIDWRKVSREQEHAAAKAAMTSDHTAYIKLLEGALRPLDRSSPPSMFWPESDKGKSS
jgi:cell filamentation protein